MNKESSSYVQILKATSIFGGVKIFQIFISIIRSKVVAILLGPTGMGIIGLLNSTLDLINQFSKLGLDTSAVKDIAVAHYSENQERLRITSGVLRRLVWFTGILGSIVTMALSPFLSRLVFGNGDYTLAFIWLSIVLFFRQLTIGQLAILQGMRKLKYLAKANLYGSIVGLLLTIPLYYFFRLDAIVPVIILGALISLGFSWYFSNKLGIRSKKVSTLLAFSEGKEMLKLGFVLSLSGLITTLVAYLAQLFIRHTGGLEQVGFYMAGFMIINTYIGMVFNAMQTDYFPRLSGLVGEPEKLQNAVFEQAIVALLLITPIIILFLTLAPMAITLLFSNKFLPITILVGWGILGTLFKAVSWSMGYVILVKGDSGLFMKTDIVFNALYITIIITGYHYFGLLGVGIGFLIYYIIHFVGIKVITFYRYNLYLDKSFNRVFLACLLLCGITFILGYIERPVLKYSLMGLMLVISVVYTVYQLNVRADLKSLLKVLIAKKKND